MKLLWPVAVALCASALASPGIAATPASTDNVQLAPSYPQRPVPIRGTHRSVVLQMFGQPANEIADNDSGSDIWDYGTFRVFFVNDEVEFARVW